MVDDVLQYLQINPLGQYAIVHRPRASLLRIIATQAGCSERFRFCGQASQFHGNCPCSTFYKENIVKHRFHVCLSWWSSVAQVRSAWDWISGAGSVSRTTPAITSIATSSRRQEPSPVTSHRVLSRAGNEAGEDFAITEEAPMSLRILAYPPIPYDLCNAKSTSRGLTQV